MSDFNLYGGIYRYLNLVYVPRVSIDHVHVSPKLSKDLKSAELKIEATIYNPDGIKGQIPVEYTIQSPDGQKYLYL